MANRAETDIGKIADPSDSSKDAKRFVESPLGFGLNSATSAAMHSVYHAPASVSSAAAIPRHRIFGGYDGMHKPK